MRVRAIDALSHMSAVAVSLTIMALPSDDGPTSAAECGHLVCHALGPPRGPRAAGRFYFDSCSWDGEVIATAEPAPSGSHTTLTSDPGRLCVTCEATSDGFAWQNLPCEPSIEWADRDYHSEPDGTERCQCHATRTDTMFAYAGPTSRAQCGKPHTIALRCGMIPSSSPAEDCVRTGHLICHQYGGRYIFGISAATIAP